MCYSLYLSTTSPEDLTRHNSELLRFEFPDVAGKNWFNILKNQQKWYVGSKSGCSCTFRHLLSIELGFGEPEEWYPEDEDELQATVELYRVIAPLVSEGYQVDCLDIWEGAVVADLKTKVVDLNAVSERAFRLFENYHFIFERNQT